MAPSLRSLSLFLLMVVFVAQPVAADPPRAVTTTVTVTPEGAAASTDVTGVGLPYHPSRVLVRFRSGARAFLPGSGPARGFSGHADLFLVPTPPGLSVAETVQRYKGNPNVVYAEPDFEVRTLANPTNDPLWPQQWDMAKISAPAAWQQGQTSVGNVVVAIIDTGIDFTHPDLAANVDRTNSYVCINGPCVLVPGPDNGDDFGHGTHVAGTIGAVTNNATGIAGINWTIKMISMKFLNAGGSGFISDAVFAFNKIVELKQAGLNIRVTSNSWGGGGFTQSLKDAMAAAEAEGIVHVCAAGNNGQPADVNPMFPAAYDNRGIVSVLATDLNDVGAGFTNYGLMSVDLAAPGVATLSTVPFGACSLCDASGYKLLSGTSMATPHVSGVMAALLYLNPALTAAQARDVILDPSSYDVMTDARAKSTSTGGRLNFLKAINSPRLFSPEPLNTFPTLTMGGNVFASAGQQVTLSATPFDADSIDQAGLRMQWAKLVSTGSSWLFGWMLNSIFPDPSPGGSSFVAPSLARMASIPYDASVADNRGGGAHGQQIVTVAPAAAPGGPPTGTLTLSASSAPVGSTIRVNFPVTDPEGTTTAWDVWAAGQYGSSGWCCFTSAFVDITFNGAGVYRIGVQAIDRELYLSTRQTAVLQIGGAPGTPPLAVATLDKVSGVVPFSVNIDMSGSSDTEGPISTYYIGCGGGFTSGSGTPTGSCTFTTPGTYWLLLQVQDNTGNMDLMSAYVVASPPNGGGGDTTAPTVAITAPTNGTVVSGPITVTADASDPGGSGVAKVEFRLDNASSGPLLGTATTSPYSVPWNPTGTAAGPHTIYAIATDNANNANSTGVGITIPAPPPPAAPTVNIALSPAPTKKAAVTITANVTVAASLTVNRVEFYINNVLVGTDTTPSTYTYAWKVPAAAGKTYVLFAKVYDSAGQTATSSAITVKP